MEVTKQEKLEGKQKLCQEWFDGELSYEDLKLMEKEAVKEESFELAEVIKSAIDWIDKLRGKVNKTTADIGGF